MRDWIGTSRAGLLSNPGFRNAPSLGQFFRCQYFEEWSGCRFIVLRLFSGHMLYLGFNDLRRTAVHRTAIRETTSFECGSHLGARGFPAIGSNEVAFGGRTEHNGDARPLGV